MSAPVQAPSSAGKASDATLIEHSWQEPELFAALFDRHAPRLHRYVARRLGDDLADDLVSEVFLAAFRQRRTYQLDRSDALPWLYGIASNKIRAHQRAEVNRYKAYGRTGRLPEGTDPAIRVVEEVSAHALRRPLAAALARLKSEERDVLLLVAWGDLGYREVADALSIPVGTVRSRLNRARKKVRKALGGSDPTLEEPWTT